MQVNNNTPNFTGLVRINPKNLNNLKQDIADSSKIASNSSAFSGGSTAYATAAPLDMASDLGIMKFLTKKFDGIFKIFNKIKNRNANPFEITNKAAAKVTVKNVVESGSTLSTGSSLISTGIGGYASTVGSAMDQTVHYPTLGSGLIPDKIVDACSNNFLEQTTYNMLYREHGFGNESASSLMPPTSGFGYLSQLIGSTMIKEIKNPKATKVLDKQGTKLPS